MINRCCGWRAVAVLCLGSVLTAPVLGQAEDAAAAKLWDDFNHYVLIARPDLAAGIGQKLQSIDDQQLLRVVEASSYIDYKRTLDRAVKIDTLSELAKALQQRIQRARIERATDPERIKADIARLTEGARANLNATERLRAAGEYAIPLLLETLQDQSRKSLHPYVLAVCVAIGRPAVYPLAVALPHLEPVTQGQVAQTLAEIGYPRALPFMKEVMENPGTDATAKGIVESAYMILGRSAGVPSGVSAAELYLTLGQNHYDAASLGEAIPGFDPAKGSGNVWQMSRNRALVPTAVPGEVFGYVLAMRSAHRAMELNPSLAPALSLWLMANLTRENRLPEGKEDQSYPKQWLDAAFYLKMAGPLRQHDVLYRALADRDPVLALDAIAALRATAGTDALINREGTIQPLLTALNYPDRRVRFHAAYTLANARPSEPFPGSHRVAPVLAEAIRQSETRYAIALARDEDGAKLLAGVIREGLKMEGSYATRYDQIIDDLAGKAGLDLLLVDLDVEATIALARQRAGDYRLVAAPMIAMAANTADLAMLNAAFEKDSSIFPIMRSTDVSGIKPAVDEITRQYAGDPIKEAEATALAAEALDLLRDIAIRDDKVFAAADAEPALIQALSDKRQSIAIQASQVLAMLKSNESQRQIADAALTAIDPALKVSLLNSLAESATQLGNRLNEPQIDKLLELVRTSSDEMAQAAARAHGALTLPAAHVVEMLTESK